MGANYDSAAILTVGKIFRQTTSHRNRWLIVLSDGLPFGRGYQGKSAIKASAEAVAKVRSQGIQVINVAIEDFNSEAIYGKPYVLKYTDLNELVMNIRKFLVRLFRASF
jgi:nitric oxide reductase activation protein